MLPEFIWSALWINIVLNYPHFVPIENISLATTERDGYHPQERNRDAMLEHVNININVTLPLIIKLFYGKSLVEMIW